MINVKREGSNENLMILLQGTGGDATSLFDLAAMIDPHATYVGIQGNVDENGVTRYFKRYPNGQFDLKSLAKETYELKNEIDKIIEANSELKKVIVLGYSNGANIAQNIMKEFDVSWDTVLLFHPVNVRPEVPFKYQPSQVLITYGDKDPYVSKENYQAFKELLKQANIKYDEVVHDYGHSLIKEEIDAAITLLSK